MPLNIEVVKEFIYQDHHQGSQLKQTAKTQAAIQKNEKRLSRELTAGGPVH